MAAALSCSLGHMEEYCELLIQLEEWTAALAIAPTVSLSYWRSLCARHADHLVEKSAESAIVTPYMIAAGATPHALQYMISRHEFEEAATLATAHSAGMLPLGASGTSIPPSPLASPNGSPAVKATAGGLGLPPSAVAAAAPLMVSEARARRFHEEGEGVLAACCYLSNGEATQSINELLRTHQLELALALALPLNALALQPILLMLAYRAERLHEWSLALDLLQRTREPQHRARSSVFRLTQLLPLAPCLCLVVLLHCSSKSEMQYQSERSVMPQRRFSARPKFFCSRASCSRTR